MASTGAGAPLLTPSGTRDLLEDRADAGRALAELLDGAVGVRPVVLAIPRGGAEVAEEIAARLAADRDLLVARKIGAPRDPEYGLGAVAEGGVRFLDRARIRDAGVTVAHLEPRIRAEEAEVERRSVRYRAGRNRLRLQGRDAVLVDDGVATGGTMFAAIESARSAGAASVSVALGVCPPATAERLRRRTDRLAIVLVPQAFEAVGQWYRHFPPVDDERVGRYLRLTPP